jgi:hypothetical protein
MREAQGFLIKKSPPVSRGGTGKCKKRKKPWLYDVSWLESENRVTKLFRHGLALPGRHFAWSNSGARGRIAGET